jgi:hypothetical protein
MVQGVESLFLIDPKLRVKEKVGTLNAFSIFPMRKCYIFFGTDSDRDPRLLDPNLWSDCTGSINNFHYFRFFHFST